VGAASVGARVSEEVQVKAFDMVLATVLEWDGGGLIYLLPAGVSLTGQEDGGLIQRIRT
jgi:hypothetical protein